MEAHPELKKLIKNRIDGKGIRLDVYVEDKGNNRTFDVEMQISDSDDFGKRMRYYQGQIDLDKLKRGQHYSALGESYIIFICHFDKFGKGRRIYTFREFCVDDKGIALNDGVTKIFLNTKVTVGDVNEDVRHFLNYVESGEFVEKLDEAVNDVKFSVNASREYMTYQMEILENRREAIKKAASIPFAT